MATELFPGQEPEERVYLVIREHWLYFLSRLSIWIIIAIALVLVDHYAQAYVPIVSHAPYVSYIDLVKTMLLLFITLGVFITWTLYYLNTKIVTDQRVVEISHQNIFSHTISELSLSKIEDVTSETKGLLGNIFGFGNVYIQTAGREERFVFKSVPQPDKLERLILNLYDQKMKTLSPAQANEIQP
jgi:hypothetical protein